MGSKIKNYNNIFIELIEIEKIVNRNEETVSNVGGFDDRVGTTANKLPWYRDSTGDLDTGQASS